jgi:hypothetical protein
MNPATKLLADGIVDAVKALVKPLNEKLATHAEINGHLAREIMRLVELVAELEAKAATLRRVA